VAKQRGQRSGPDWPAVYQIRIEGHLGRAWAGWFAGLSIALEDNGDTLLTGTVVDQAALHGLLKKVRDLGAPLVSVNRLEPGPAPRPTEEGDRDVH
jgi:hypothetical protein